MDSARRWCRLAVVLALASPFVPAARAEDAPAAPPAPAPADAPPAPPPTTVRDDDDAVLAWFDTLGLPSAKDHPWVHVVGADPKSDEVFAAGVLLDDSPTAFVVLRDGLIRTRFQRAARRFDAGYAFRPADLAQDVASLLDEVSRPREAPTLRLVFEGASVRGPLVRAATLAHVCTERGDGARAAALLGAARALPRDARAPAELVRRLEASLETKWIWNAVVAFGARETPLEDLLAPLRGFLRTWPASEHAPKAKELADVLERMIGQEAAHAAAAKPLEAMTKEEQLAEWVFRLREQNGWQFGQPGEPSIWLDDREEESPAAKLLAFGTDAVPALIEAIDDDACTRTVGYWRDFTYSHYVVRVGDAALAIVERLAGRSFWSGTYTAASMVKDGEQQTTQARVRAWWKEFQAKGERGLLIDAVREGGPESASLAHRLLERYPADALEAITAGIRATKDERTRFFLAQTLRFAYGLDVAALSALFGNLLASDASLETRVMAAAWLHAHGGAGAVAAMIDLWRARALVSVPPWNLESQVERLASFLVQCGSSDAVRALADGLDAREPSIRLAVVGAIADLARGAGSPPNLAPARREAVEDLLASLFDDETGTGRTRTGGAGPIRDERVGDVAAETWFDLFAANGGATFAERPIAARDRAIAQVLEERAKAGRGPAPRPARPIPLVPTVADADVAPLVPALLEGETAKGREVRDALGRLGPGAAMALVRAAEGLPEERATPVRTLARELGLRVVHAEFDREGAAGPELDAALAAMTGKPLAVEGVLGLLHAILAAHEPGTVTIELNVSRRATDPGVVVRARVRALASSGTTLHYAIMWGRGDGDGGSNTRGSAAIGDDLASIAVGWASLEDAITWFGEVGPDVAFHLDLRLAPSR